MTNLLESSFSSKSAPDLSKEINPLAKFWVGPIDGFGVRWQRGHKNGALRAQLGIIIPLRLHVIPINRIHMSRPAGQLARGVYRLKF